MNFLIGLLLPSVVGYKFFVHINKEEKFNVESKASYYLILLLLSNTIGLLVSKIVFGLDSSLDDNLQLFSMFSFKYIVLSIIINIALAFAISFFRKNTSFSIEIKDNSNEK